jgi:hypothetical protein
MAFRVLETDYATAPTADDVLSFDGANWVHSVKVATGTYTPVLTNAANLSASTPQVTSYMRVGNMVIVAGSLEADPSVTSTLTQLRISLPIASNFANYFECGGTANAYNIVSMCAGISGDTTNDTALMQWIATDVTNQAWGFIFMYRIIQ